VLSALGPLTGSSWMTAVSPFDWYLCADPLTAGMDWAGAALLLRCSTLFAAGGYSRIGRRDLMS
jgi:ABC-2 type transport system permease protein